MGAALGIADKSPIRITVIGLRGFPEVVGGIETHCELLYESLAQTERDLAVTVYMRKGGVSADAVYPAGLHVRRVWAPRLPGAEALVHTMLSLVLTLVLDPPDIVHIHGIGPALLTPIARLAGRKVVVTHHSRNQLHRKWGWFARSLFRAGEAVSARMACRVICVSNSLRASFLTAHPQAAACTEVIAHGSRFAELSVPDTGLLDRLGLKAGGYALAYGRLDPTKRFDDIIVAHRIKGESGAKVLVIAGEAGGNHDHAAPLLALGGPDVRLIGRRDHAELRELIAHSAVTVHASESEGFGLALLECALSGARVIASDIPPFREIGMPASSYFPAGDIAVLAAKMAAPPPPLGHNAHADLHERYSAARMVREHAALYRELAGRSARAAVAKKSQ